MKIRVLLFATLKDIAGTNQITLNLTADSATVRTVRDALTSQYPEIQANIEAAIASINREYAFDHETVSEGDEVAFFPPVSGGSEPDPKHPELFMLPTEPIDHDEFIAAITTDETGAVCLFSGIVRGRTDKEGHLPHTDFLEYEAYHPMAMEKMKQVAAEIRQRWPKVLGIAIAQRIGKLKIRENTVLIACSSPHRDDGCFEAARYGIDRLKEIVPVWKKEVSPDGEAWIEGEYRPTPADRPD